jgi:hypothetical protein
MYDLSSRWRLVLGAQKARRLGNARRGTIIMHRRRSCLILLLRFLFLTPVAGAATLHVPADYSTIQLAINAAAAGDTVELACGTYFEHDIVMRDHLVLRVASPFERAGCAIIDAQQLGRVMTGDGLQDATIEGITMTHGSAAGDGGGLRLQTSTVVLRHCRFSDNAASGEGGGLCYAATPTPRTLISECEFVANVAREGGGAVADVDLANCVFRGNRSTSWGGGLALRGSGDLKVSGSEFLDNRSEHHGGAVSFDIFAFQPRCRFVNCSFEGNSAARSGAVAMVVGWVTFSGCLMAWNNAEGWGGAIEVVGSWELGAYATLTGCTLVHNSPSAVFADSDLSGEATVVSDRSVFAYSAGPAWQGNRYYGWVTCTDIFWQRGGRLGRLAGRTSRGRWEHLRRPALLCVRGRGLQVEGGLAVPSRESP